MMNIVEAMTKFNKQYVILISGPSGSGCAKIAKFLADKFKFQCIRLADYTHSNTIFDVPSNYIKLNDATSALPWDNIYKSIDWKNFNESIEFSKNKGIIAYGLGFPTANISFKPDLHIHIKISRENLLNKRHAYIEKHKDNPNAKYVGTDTELLIFDKITYFYYVKARNEANVSRFVNANQMTFDEIKHNIFKYIMTATEHWLGEHKKSI